MLPLATKHVMKLSNDCDWLYMDEHRDSELSKMFQSIKEGTTGDAMYIVKYHILYLRVIESEKGQLDKVVPQSYQWSLINHYHEVLKHFV